MKKTIIALMALTGVACADTINLLTDGDWTTGSRLERATWSKNDAGALTLTNSNWSQAYAIYDFESNVTDVWEFSTTVKRYDGNAGFTVTLVGTDKAISIGTKEYTDGTSFYGTTTEVNANGYSFKDDLSEISGTKVEPAMEGAEGVFNTNQDAYITASTKFDNDKNVILTLTLDGTAVSTPFTTTINLGTDFTLDKVCVWGDGGNGKNNWAVTKMSLKSIPEPTTATLSLLALAGLAARRRRK